MMALVSPSFLAVQIPWLETTTGWPIQMTGAAWSILATQQPTVALSMPYALLLALASMLASVLRDMGAMAQHASWYVVVHILVPITTTEMQHKTTAVVDLPSMDAQTRMRPTLLQRLVQIKTMAVVFT
jgi:hypothetical protein